MKNLTKLALVSALALSGNAFAMQALDDAELSATTGQDGVTVKLDGNISFDYLAIVDGDGVGNNYGVTATGTAAIVVGDTVTPAPVTITAANGVNVIIDADDNGGAPLLNINLNLGDTDISVGSLGVASSDATGKTLTNNINIIDIGTITLGGLEVNVQLGNQAQGAMIQLDSTIQGGLEISDLTLRGQNGGIGLGTVNLSTNGNANGDLVLDLAIDPVAGSGLEITGLTGIDVAASSLNLGGDAADYAGGVGMGATPTTALGALYVSNLSVGKVTISGH